VTVVLINTGDLNAVRRAVTNAHTALVLAARDIRKVEDQTTWKGPGRRQYDELSAQALGDIDRFARGLERAERDLDQALIRLGKEMADLDHDQRRVEDIVKGATPTPVLPRPGTSQVLEKLRWSGGPPRGDTEWAVMARTVDGRSRSVAW
jgi:hypothetical protein